MEELKPCKHAEYINPGEYECTEFCTVACQYQRPDLNPDGSINIMLCNALLPGTPARTLRGETG